LRLQSFIQSTTSPDDWRPPLDTALLDGRPVLIALAVLWPLIAIWLSKRPVDSRRMRRYVWATACVAIVQLLVLGVLLFNATERAVFTLAIVRVDAKR
jgi:hypothetical protein